MIKMILRIAVMVVCMAAGCGEKDGGELREVVGKSVVLDETAEVESYEWLDERKTCLRVKVQYVEKPEGEYRHKEDYFFFLEGDQIQVLYVDYPGKDYENIGKDRYVWDACDFDAYLEDVTFDGHKDLLISLGHGGVHGTCIFAAYIYRDGIYEYERSFEEIPNYEVDKEQECVRGQNVNSADSVTFFRYIYDQNEFVKVEENTVSSSETGTENVTGNSE